MTTPLNLHTILPSTLVHIVWDNAEFPPVILNYTKPKPRYNYKRMTECRKSLATDLFEYFYNPKRLEKLSKLYGFNICDIDEIY